MITLLKPIGHCFGVLKAIEIAKETKEKYLDKNIYVFGLLVHNEEVVKELENNDIKTIDTSKEDTESLLNKFTKDDVIIFTAHGHPEKYESILKKNNVTYVDATCSKVKECFLQIKAAKEVIYIGKKGHPETTAALTMNKNAYLYDINQGFDYSLVKTSSPLVINQTTLSYLELEDIHNDIKRHLPNVIINDEICNATLLRQKAIQELDDSVDTLIIVGSKKSSNTMKLVEVANKMHKDKQIIFVENLEQLKELDIKFTNAAITSGTSTPYQTIAKIKEYLEALNNE